MSKNKKNKKLKKNSSLNEDKAYIILTRAELQQSIQDALVEYDKAKEQEKINHKNERKRKIFSQLDYKEYTEESMVKRYILYALNTLFVWFAKLCWSDIKILLPTEKPPFTMFHFVPCLLFFVVECVLWIASDIILIYSFLVPGYSLFARIGQCILGAAVWGISRIGPRATRLRLRYTSDEGILMNWTGLVLTIVSLVLAIIGLPFIQKLF